MTKVADRLGNALAFAPQRSVTYEDSAARKTRQTEAKVCPVCRHETSDLVADHDHATGYSRERICRCCNAGLGMFRDNAAALRRAARYLETHRRLNRELTIGKHLKPSMRRTG